ncbi:MAG: hypothetical protein A2Y79_03815 [Deltaproteobacteria bacterium RBG_13_43_22]|nr:MAG: hypothetical protein A2Y79_03815 [Deltaproteobacteria bacterium RBG_13_43_22]
MQKTVKFLNCRNKRDFNTDNLECHFKLSVIETALIGTPREISNTHKLKLTITDRLMNNWNLEGAEWSAVTESMLKVAFQSAEEYVTGLLKKCASLEEEFPPLFMETKNSPKTCPYNLSNITYPRRDTFIVNLDDQKDKLLLKACVEEFKSYIQSEKRMTFWQYEEAKNPKWISHPEKRAKDLLHTFLVGKFGTEILTFEEITSGAGRMDIFVITPTGEKVIIELKMCGRGYTSGYAQEGIEQLTHYMANKKTNLGFLMVFDARARDFSKGFLGTQAIDGMNITTTIADLRPFVKQKDFVDNIEGGSQPTTA